MKILLVNYEYPPIGGGAGNATSAIARGLVALKHDAVVLTAQWGRLPPDSVEDGVRVIRLPSRRARQDRSSLAEMASYVVKAARVLPRLVEAEKPDGAIVFFSMPCGPLGLIGKWLAKLPYVVSLRGGDVPGTERHLGPMYLALTPIRRLVLRNARAVVANSEGLKALSEAADPIPVEVIPNGVDTDFFVPAEAPPAGPFTLLFVGRFQPQKNLHFLLAALARLQQSAPRLVIVGDGPQRDGLESLARTLGIAGLVSWHAWCDKEALRAHYQAADCFINPSLYEGMPNTVLEAMACGLPVIASDVAGNSTVVTHGVTGWLYRGGDEAQLLDAMRSAVQSREECRRRGREARKRVEQTYTWRAAAQRYVDVMQATGLH